MSYPDTIILLCSPTMPTSSLVWDLGPLFQELSVSTMTCSWLQVFHVHPLMIHITTLATFSLSPSCSGVTGQWDRSRPSREETTIPIVHRNPGNFCPHRCSCGWKGLRAGYVPSTICKDQILWMVSLVCWCVSVACFCRIGNKASEAQRPSGLRQELHVQPSLPPIPIEERNACSSIW